MTASSNFLIPNATLIVEIVAFLIFISRLLFHPRRDAEADFFGVAFGVEGEEAGEDFVAVFIDPAVTPWFLATTTS